MRNTARYPGIALAQLHKTLDKVRCNVAGTFVAGTDDEADGGEDAWNVAQERATVIRALLMPGGRRLGTAAVTLAAEKLGISRSGLYRLIAIFRSAELTSTLLPTRPGRPTGARSLDARREAIIAHEIETFYLRAERPRLSDLVERIGARCLEAGIPAPNWRTIHSRVLRTDAERRARKRQDHAALANLLPVPGEFTVERPLDVVQIDHTPVDVFVVDAEDRLAMTRPWLTLAIDVHTRMVVGFHLSLNEPSVISVGLCLLNAVFDKSALLDGMEVDAPWPTAGIPRIVQVDNGPEFHSKAFLRGCQEHGIHVDWRPPGTPRYGGHIERLIGSQMGAMHVLPGSTGRSVADRQGRDALAGASLTMRELERWVLLEIVGKYHHKIHSSLKRPPISLWRELAGSTPLRLPPNRLAFWVAFLPEQRRLLRRDGIHLFGIRYWSPALSQDVGRSSESLKVRYDPRDLSTVFVRRSNGHFIEARYRTLGRPAISLWERNGATKRLREKGRKEFDEDMIFKSVLEQRGIEDRARQSSARARLNRERRPPGLKEKQNEIRLRDIDMAASTVQQYQSGSSWDES